MQQCFSSDLKCAFTLIFGSRWRKIARVPKSSKAIFVNSSENLFFQLKARGMAATEADEEEEEEEEDDDDDGDAGNPDEDDEDDIAE